MTARHEFDAYFLRNTFRNLAVNDIIDQLGPIVYELIRNGVIEKVDEDITKLGKLREDYFRRETGIASNSRDQQTRDKEAKYKFEEFKKSVDRLLENVLTSVTNTVTTERLGRLKELNANLEDTSRRCELGFWHVTAVLGCQGFDCGISCCLQLQFRQLPASRRSSDD